MNRTDQPDRAVTFEAPAFTVAQSLRDPRREAAELADRRRDSGFDEGFTRGWAKAEAEVNAAIGDHRRSAERLEQCCVVFERAAEDLARKDQVALTDIERHVVAFAAELAAEIIGRELDVVDQPVLESLERVAQLLPDRGSPTLRVHPNDAATAREAVEADLVRWRNEVQFVADTSVEEGGCVVEVGPCRIDGQIGSAIERMRISLRDH